MKRAIVLFISICMLFLASGCGGQRNTLAGLALGGVGGGVLGSYVGSGTGQIAAIIGGTLGGAAIGGSVGNYLDRMDEHDHKQMNTVLEKAPDGRTSKWSNPNNNITHRVTPENTYKHESGQYCREFNTNATVGGQNKEIYGTACRQSNGAWKVVQMNNQA